MSAKIDVEKDKLAFEREKMEKWVDFSQEKIDLVMKKSNINFLLQMKWEVLKNIREEEDSEMKNLLKE